MKTMEVNSETQGGEPMQQGAIVTPAFFSIYRQWMEDQHRHQLERDGQLLQELRRKPGSGSPEQIENFRQRIESRKQEGAGGYQTVEQLAQRMGELDPETQRHMVAHFSRDYRSALAEDTKAIAEVMREGN